MKAMPKLSSARRGAGSVRVGVVDFFCGCGGTSAGIAAAKVPGASVEIVAGLDIDPHACATYEKMIGAPALQLDIRRLAEHPAELNALVASWRLERFDKLLLIGCAPCQGFAAHRKAVEGEDERRSLFVTFCKIASALRPDAVLLENVPDMFSKAHWPFYAAGRKILNANGYFVRGQIHNLAGFGLPQERFRALMMAFPYKFPMPEPHLDHPQFRTVREAIGHLPAVRPGEQAAGDPMHVTSKHRPSTVSILSKIPRDGGNRPVGVGPKCLDRARAAHGGFTDVYGRLAWDRPAVTITARCRTPSCGRFAHPEQDRGLSVREAALLQGFPKDFQFEGPWDDKFKQIGNAVPPLVAKAVGEHALRVLLAGPPASYEMDTAFDVEKAVGPGFAVTINGIKRRREVQEPSLAEHAHRT